MAALLVCKHCGCDRFWECGDFVVAVDDSEPEAPYAFSTRLTERDEEETHLDAPTDSGLSCAECGRGMDERSLVSPLAFAERRSRRRKART